MITVIKFLSKDASPIKTVLHGPNSVCTESNCITFKNYTMHCMYLPVVILHMYSTCTYMYLPEELHMYMYFPGDLPEEISSHVLHIIRK